MVEHLREPSVVPVPGGKVIHEWFGRVRTDDTAASVAHMRAPAGWAEPAQVPEFDELTLVLRGAVRVEHEGGVIDAGAGEAVLSRAGERVRYSVPADAGDTEYVAICVPAFGPDLANRED